MKTYTFHVSLPRRGRVWRKIEMRAEQTLQQLHRAILNAYDFDSDHLYSFFMSGKAWDSKTEYSLPEGVTPYDRDDGEAYIPMTDYEFALEVYGQEVADLLALPPDEFQRYLEERQTKTGESSKFIEMIFERMREAIAADNRLTDVRKVTLESLRLTVGKEFMYLFDYGDEWRFKVKVQAINPDAPDGDMPRIIESVGKAPPQYRNWDNDEDEDES